MYKQVKSVPEAYITRTQAQSRGRYKIIDSNIYIKNGQEFELELYNPTQNVIMASLSFNGEISSGGAGLVIKPGQRIYLDRYLNEATKFKFETYTVEKSESAAQAIQQNGTLAIKFYNEVPKLTYIRNAPYFGNPITWQNLNNNNINVVGSARFGYVNTGITGNINCNSTVSGNSCTTSTANLVNHTIAGASINYTNNIDASSFSSLNDSFLSEEKIPVGTDSLNEIETGRIEKGSRSNQEFVTADYNFSSFSFHEVKYNLLPESNQILEGKDLIKFCTHCGAKAKKEHNFCAKCGKQL